MAQWELFRCFAKVQSFVRSTVCWHTLTPGLLASVKRCGGELRRIKNLTKTYVCVLQEKLGYKVEFYRWESFAMNMDTHTSGSTVKNHISLKTGFGYNAIRKTSYQSWLLVNLSEFFLKLVYLAHDPSKEIDHSDHTPATVSSESVDRQVR